MPHDHTTIAPGPRAPLPACTACLYRLPAARCTLYSLNVLELKSLEEPRYLLGEFAKQPLACLTLAAFMTTNTGWV